MALERSGHGFWTLQFPRWSGAAAMLGGLLFAVGAVLHSLQPIGCEGMECETRAMRSTTAVAGIAGIAAGLLILIGIAGLSLLARQSHRNTRLANAALASAAVGFAVVLLAVLIQLVFFDGDWPWMPFVVIPGMLAVVVGFFLIGIFILRSHVLPRWLGVVLLVSSIVLVAVNEQTQAVLLAIPFGLAIAAAGFFMWNGSGQQAAAPSSRQAYPPS